MAISHLPTPNPVVLTPNQLSTVVISVSYNETDETVTVSPSAISRNTTVHFENPKGGKLRIVFQSPTGKEIETVLDSQVCMLTIGGTYHFRCFFTPKGATGEFSPVQGGVIDVIPQRP